jgi:hypothetical protein
VSYFLLVLLCNFVKVESWDFRGGCALGLSFKYTGMNEIFEDGRGQMADTRIVASFVYAICGTGACIGWC